MDLINECCLPVNFILTSGCKYKIAKVCSINCLSKKAAWFFVSIKKNSNNDLYMGTYTQTNTYICIYVCAHMRIYACICI